jgi:tetratricopeptide (TPR) repeat protein
VGRFSNLEFRDPKKVVVRPAAPADPLDANRDDAYYMAQAEAHFRGGRFEKALRLYSRALEYDPNLHAGWLGQLRMLVELGELNEAVVWAGKGLDIHRDNPELLSAKAVATARRGDPAKGLEFSDLAMQKQASSVYVWLARGEVLLADGQQAADKCFQKSVAEAKGDWFASALVSRVHHHWRRDTAALVWANAAVEKDATKALAWACRGDAEMGLGLLGMAKSSYLKACSLDRECEPARKGLETLAFAGFFARVAAWFRQLGARR